MRRSRVFLPWSLLAGLLALTVAADGLKATALVLGKLRGQTSTTTDIPTAEGDEGTAAGSDLAGEVADKTEDGNSTSPVSHLTGVPQKDYVFDPNLPRELNGYNLTEYPFYDRVPEEMDFKCDGLHDGFYASVEHKCQVYHHCLFGTRYDFLCANYTAFDQKTFICHFVSEVDCQNSPKYFKRNEALYKAATTTTVAPPPPPPSPPPSAPARRPQQQTGGRRKRPYSRPRRPVYDYYYDEDYEEDPEYYDDEVAPPTGKGGSARRNRKHPRRPDDGTEDSVGDDTVPVDPKSLYERPRVPPKIRRPVPLNERDKYDYGSNRPTLAPPPSTTTTTTTEVPSTSSRSKHEDDYYDDEEYVPPARTRPKNQDYYPPTAGGVERDIVRRPPMSGAGRPIRRRPAGSRRRPPADTLYDDYYDYDFEDELPRRPARPHRKRTRQPDRAYNSQRNAGRYDVEEEVEPIPASRPAYISSSAARASFRKRPAQQPDLVDDYRPSSSQGSSGYKRPAVSRKQVPSRYADEADDDYYEDEVEEEPVYRRSRPSPNSRVSYQQDEVPTAPARSSPSNKRPFTSPARSNGASSSLRTNQSPSKSLSPNAAEVVEDRSMLKVSPTQQPIRQRPEPDFPAPKVSPNQQPLRQRPEPDLPAPKVSPTQQPIRQKPEPDLSALPRPAFRPKSTTTTAPVIEKIPEKISNIEDSIYDDEDSQDFRSRDPSAELPPRVPPSSYGSFRSKLSQSERDLLPRNGNSKSRLPVNDPEHTSGISSTIPPSAPAKDSYEEIPPSRIRPVKVLVKPVERSPARIPEDIPEQQNLADINEHEYDITLNDALHPTLHPARNIEQQRPYLPKIKSNYVTRAVNSQIGDASTLAPARGSAANLESSASQTHVTRTAFPLHNKYESTTDASYRSHRPASQYEEVRYREQDEVPVSRYQQRNSWSRREPTGSYYTN